MLSQQFIEEMKLKLLEAQAKLKEDLGALKVHTEMGDEQDENAEEVEVDDVNKNLMPRLESDLEKIETALNKIADGSYGKDAEGKEISEERLRALPWADKAL